MRFAALMLVVCAALGFAQTAEDPEVARARMEVDRIRILVQTSALPRGQLIKAEESLSDANDSATIRKSIFSQDLTEDQANDLVAAANRRFERRKKAYDDAKKLVDIGAMPSQTLANLLQDMDFARQESVRASSRADIAKQVAEMAEAELAVQAHLAEHPTEAPKIAERFDGDGIFTPQIFERIEQAFEKQFGKPLPVSANGETAVHRALGFDHRGRVDVALHPDTPEGIWLREYLTERRVPFFAFRQAVAGKATGAHIHLGPISTHLAPTDSGG